MDAPPDPLALLPEGPRLYRVPWLPLEGEPADHYALFLRFCSAPGTTISSFSGAVGRDIKHIAYAQRWRARRAAYEAHMRAEVLEGGANHAREIGRFYASAWFNLGEWAVASLLQHQAEGRVLPVRDAVMILTKACEFQRLYSGESTVNLGIAHANVPSHMLEDLLNKVDEIERIERENAHSDE